VLADSPHGLHKFRILRAREPVHCWSGDPAKGAAIPVKRGGKMRRFLTVPLAVVLAGFPGFAGSGGHFARLAGNQAKRLGYAARTSPIRRDARSGASS
jgi:hypothetical protein